MPRTSTLAVAAVLLRCLALLLLWFVAVSAAAQRPLRLDAEAPAQVELRPHLSWLADPEAALDATSALRAPGFAALAAGSGLNFGYRRGALWLRLELESGAAHASRWRLELDYAPLDQVELYEPARAGAAALQRSGDALPFAARSLPHRNPVFAFDLAPGERRSLLLRVQSQSSLTLNPSLWRADAFGAHSQTGYAVHALYLGMLLALGAYNALLWLALRDRAFALYVGFVFGMGLGVASLYGLAGQYLWPDAIEWGNRSLCVGFALTGVVGPLFTRDFLGTARTAPGWHRLLGALTGLNIAVLGVALFGPVRLGMQLTSIATLVSCLATLGGGLACAWRGVPGARLFVAAWAVLLLGGGAMALRNFGLLPTHFVTLYGMQIGSALEMLLLSFALAARFNQLKREKEQAQAESLASQQQLVRTLQQQERALELRVAERTEALAAANAQLRELALHDPLTGLANRAALYARLEQAPAHAATPRRPATLLLIDLDGFKAVNDRLGHEAGDRLLVAVAERLTRTVRGNDLVARLGGDEFVVLLDEIETPAQARRLGEALLATLAEPFAIGGEVARIGASIGLASASAAAEPELLLRRADRAMYAAKAAGRGQLRGWNEPVEPAAPPAASAGSATGDAQAARDGPE